MDNAAQHDSSYSERSNLSDNADSNNEIYRNEDNSDDKLSREVNECFDKNERTILPHEMTNSIELPRKIKEYGSSGNQDDDSDTNYYNDEDVNNTLHPTTFPLSSLDQENHDINRKTKESLMENPASENNLGLLNEKSFVDNEYNPAPSTLTSNDMSLVNDYFGTRNRLESPLSSRSANPFPITTFNNYRHRNPPPMPGNGFASSNPSFPQSKESMMEWMQYYQYYYPQYYQQLVSQGESINPPRFDSKFPSDKQTFNYPASSPYWMPPSFQHPIPSQPSSSWMQPPGHASVVTNNSSIHASGHKASERSFRQMSHFFNYNAYLEQVNANPSSYKSNVKLTKKEIEALKQKKKDRKKKRLLEWLKSD